MLRSRSDRQDSFSSRGRKGNKIGQVRVPVADESVARFFPQLSTGAASAEKSHHIPRLGGCCGRSCKDSLAGDSIGNYLWWQVQESPINQKITWTVHKLTPEALFLKTSWVVLERAHDGR